MTKRHQTQIKLSNEEIIVLLDALEGQHTEDLSINELDIHDRLIKRLDRAYGRLH